MKALFVSFFSTRVQDKSLNLALLVFRSLVALSMLHTHGLKKIRDFEGTVAHIPDPFGIGGEASTILAMFANILCTSLVVIGFSTRLAALFILSVTLVGLLIVHANDPWLVKDVPLMYSLSFALIAYLGAGKYSIDYSIHKWHIK